ncbi:hypothetical protein ABPG77_010567 [Micractinium sp. CCAP 211/92]
MLSQTRGLRRAQVLASFWLLLLLHAVKGQVSENALAVQDQCPSSSYYGEDFYVGATLMNNTITTLSGCCRLCGNTPLCTWTWCPSNATDGCVAPLGPMANTTFPAGTCLISLLPTSSGTLRLAYSRMQGGNPWVAGATSGSPQYIDSASSYSDDRETLSGGAGDQFLCRKISGGTLKLSPLRGNGSSSLDVTDGQEVRYTGIRLVDSAGQAWSVIFQNSSSSSAYSSGGGGPLWQYPADQLAFCDTPTTGCAANAFGQSTEEGASCDSSSDCGVCGGNALTCEPRGTTDMQLAYTGVTNTGQAPTFPLGTGSPWDAQPNECRQQLNISAPLGPTDAVYSTLYVLANEQNKSTICYDFNLTAYADPNAPPEASWVEGPITSAPSGPPRLEVDKSDVDAFIQQLCSNTATANASLANAILAGGAEAQKAFLAMQGYGSQNDTRTLCPDGTRLMQLFVDYVSARGIVNEASAQNYASQFVEAADSAGRGVCVGIAVVSPDLSRVLETYRIQNPSPTTPASPSPPAIPPGSYPSPGPSLSPSPGPSPSPSPGASPSPPALLPNGTVRLAGNQSCTQGRAEVAMAGSWGAVCSAAGGGDAGNQRNAQVICRGQGLPSSQPAVSAAAAPEGSPVWIKDLNCTGSESSILDCPYTMADGSSAGSQDCPSLSITCVDSASAGSAAAAMCTQRPGRCQKLPGSCDPGQGYCTFVAQPVGTPCLGGACNERGECAARG